MQITINKQKTDIELENEKTLGDVLRAFQKSFEENDAALIGLGIDDLILHPNDLAAFMEKPLSEISDLNLETILLSDIREALATFTLPLETLSNQFLDIGVLYQANKDTEVSKIITEFADFFSSLSKTISLLSLFPNYFNKTKINDEMILDYLNNFSSILIEFENALANNDKVLVADLAEYEIAPSLETLSVFCKNN
ncbi:MAG TPA: hypothetical protein PKW26_06620 [Treponemataceae bacterium]|nr:hypothetical protein [Treponemataceae bacterium]HOQ93275.1 hypothetical protein [Treponemataceae bacterium]HPM06643.1 hypothetical protein [Treponemataceae bacterium]